MGVAAAGITFIARREREAWFGLCKIYIQHEHKTPHGVKYILPLSNGKSEGKSDVKIGLEE